MNSPGKAQHKQAVTAVSIIGVALELPGASDPAGFYELTVMGSPMSGSQEPAGAALPAETPRTELELAEQVAGRALANATVRADTVERAEVIIATSSGENLAAAVRGRLGWRAGRQVMATAGAVASAQGTVPGMGATQGDAPGPGDAAAPGNAPAPGEAAPAGGIAPEGDDWPGEIPVPAPRCSLRAIAAACATLSRGEADLVLAGGVSLGIDRGQSDGKTSDQAGVSGAQTAGLLPGEGCAVIALMPADEARSRGLPVYADIVGWESSDDHDSAGVVRAAYQRAGLSPGDAQYLDGHSVAAEAGDLAELTMLLDVFSAVPSRGCALGAVSSCIGDTRAVAGVAGLIKVALAMAVGTVPPTPGCEQPHDLLGNEKSPFRLPGRAEPWPQTGEQIAAVNAMTDGTTHVVLRRKPPPVRRPGRRRREADPAVREHLAPNSRQAKHPARRHKAAAGPEAARDPKKTDVRAETGRDPGTNGLPETAEIPAHRPVTLEPRWTGPAPNQLLMPRSQTRRPVIQTVPVFRPATSPGPVLAHSADTSTRMLGSPVARPADDRPQEPGTSQAPAPALTPTPAPAPALTPTPRHATGTSAPPSAEQRHWHSPTVVALHGTDREDVASALDTITSMTPRMSVADLHDFARHLAGDLTRARPVSPVRAAIVAADPEQLATRARQAARLMRTVPLAPPHTAPGIYLSDGAQGRVTLVFPGLADTPLAHTAALASSLAALTALERLGVRARSAVGYSLGEILALAWAGSITIADAARLIAYRAELLRAAPAGTAMARLKAGPEAARKLCAEIGLVIAADEGPEQQLVAGPASAIRSLGQRTGDSRVRSEALGVSCALHSPALAPLTPPMRHIAATTQFRPPRRRVVSAIAGRELTPADDIYALIATHLTAPIRFAAALTRAAEGADLIIEAGDDAALATAARACSQVSVVQAPGDTLSPATLAAMFTAGALQDLRPFLAIPVS